MDRLLVVDGSNLLFQMFFGMPARIPGKDGRAIHGTLGFVGALLKVIRRVKPTHVVALFDGEHENARAALDPDYKANRPDYSEVPGEELPFSQLPDIYRALDYLGISHMETEDCESDDWIAGYALTYGDAAEVVILSFDSDCFQLITERVSVLRYRGDHSVLCTPGWILERYGILPSQYADFKSLTGDTSDNIRGAEGVGPKTAALLLREFQTLDALLENADAVKKPSVRDSIRRNAGRLRVNQRLICLDGSAKLPLAIDSLVFRDSSTTTGEVLRGIGLR